LFQKVEELSRIIIVKKSRNFTIDTLSQITHFQQHLLDCKIHSAQDEIEKLVYNGDKFLAEND
jgi:hypothetical protein